MIQSELPDVTYFKTEVLFESLLVEMLGIFFYMRDALHSKSSCSKIETEKYTEFNQCSINRKFRFMPAIRFPLSNTYFGGHLALYFVCFECRNYVREEAVNKKVAVFSIRSN